MGETRATAAERLPTETAPVYPSRSAPQGQSSQGSPSQPGRRVSALPDGSEDWPAWKRAAWERGEIGSTPTPSRDDRRMADARRAAKARVDRATEEQYRIQSEAGGQRTSPGVMQRLRNLWRSAAE